MASFWAPGGTSLFDDADSFPACAQALTPAELAERVACLWLRFASASANEKKQAQEDFVISDGREASPDRLKQWQHPPKQSKGNWVYVAWFLFYFIFFSVITFGIAIPFYIVTGGAGFFAAG